MRRVVAVALGIAFATFAAQAALFHVHAYDDHDHGEHHHGVAAHGHHDDDHDASPAEALDEPAHFAPCQPASHVKSVAFCSPFPEPHSVLLAVLSSFTVTRPEPSTELVMVPVDARGHSPPRRPYRPLRAPPRQIPA
jgi:hypothetical protein